MDETLTLASDGGLDGVDVVHKLHAVASADPSALQKSWLLEDTTLSVGRTGGGASFTLADPSISRQHLTLSYNKAMGLYGVEDSGSKNGLFINGAKTQRRVLADGDVLRVGDSVLVYERAVDLGAAGDTGNDVFVGQSSSARALRAEVAKAAPTGMPILLQGDTGSGKEVAATLIHRLSGRSGRFQALNCGAIPANLLESTLFGHRKGAFTGATSANEGHFVAADKGTLLLDEVAELPAQAQTALLRVLEDGAVLPVGATKTVSVDVRVVAATHVDLNDAVAAGRFRQDLLARLARWPMKLAPLSDRRLDIWPLARHLVPEARRLRGVDADVVEALLIAPWPTNVRGLHAAVARACVGMGPNDTLTLQSLPDDVAAPIQERTLAAPSASVTTTDTASGGRPDAETLREVVDYHQGNISQVAQHFGKPRKQIYRWIRHHKLNLDLYRATHPDGD